MEQNFGSECCGYLITKKDDGFAIAVSIEHKNPTVYCKVGRAEA